METRTLQFITESCAGELVSGSAEARVEGVCTDSRQAKAGEVFFALVGERHDGHEHVEEAAKRGAAAVVVAGERGVTAPPGCAVIAVEDTRRALGQLGAEYRTGFEPTMVAVGGSNGKTTTKDLLVSVLGQRLATLGSEASFNNDIGVPLTLLRLEKRHEAAVVEAGTNHPGELAPLVKMIGAKYGVITNVGREHLEFFGDLAGVAQEEGWLAELLPSNGRLFLNGDGEWVGPIAKRTRASVVRAGFGPGNDWRVGKARVDGQGVVFQAEGPEAEYAGEYRMKLVGRHQVSNALLAIAVGAELGLTRAEIESGLWECKPAKMRMQLWEVNGVRVVDDAYNANADSMEAALQTLKELPCKGRRVAVLGDMAEVGKEKEAAHEEVGRRAAELGVAQLFAVGQMAPVMARGARGAGLNRVLEFAEVEAAAAAVKSFVRPGDAVLVKASRAARLERIAEGLKCGVRSAECGMGTSGRGA